MAIPNPISLACFTQISGTENKFAYLYQVLLGLYEGKLTTFGEVAASSAQTIPAGAWSYSFTVTGANAVVNGVAVKTGFNAVGVGPLQNGIVIQTGTATTVDFTYTTLANANNNNPE